MPAQTFDSNRSRGFGNLTFESDLDAGDDSLPCPRFSWIGDFGGILGTSISHLGWTPGFEVWIGRLDGDVWMGTSGWGRLDGTSGWDVWMGRLDGTSGWDVWMGRLDGTPGWDAWVGRLGGTPGWDAWVGRLGGTPGWDAGVGHLGGTLGWDTWVGHLGGTLGSGAWTGRGRRWRWTPYADPKLRQLDLAVTIKSSRRQGYLASYARCLETFSEFLSFLSYWGGIHLEICFFKADVTMNTETTEIIGIVEFAKRLKVCPNTIRNWIRSGMLVHGKHYLRCGRILRFAWSNAQILDLMAHLQPEPPSKRPKLKSNSGNKCHRKLRA